LFVELLLPNKGSWSS